MTSLSESQYHNDEMIDNQLRSVLFQVPVSGNPDCLDGPTLPQCFSGVVDLGAIDIERGRDHGMPQLQPAAAGVRARAQDLVHGRSPARPPTRSRPAPAATTRTASTS